MPNQSSVNDKSTHTRPTKKARIEKTPGKASNDEFSPEELAFEQAAAWKAELMEIQHHFFDIQIKNCITLDSFLMLGAEVGDSEMNEDE